MKKLLFITAILFFGPVTAYAQQSGHEFSASAGSASSAMAYDHQDGEVKKGMGVTFGLRYSYYLSKNWSIGLGAEYQNYESTIKMNDFRGAYSTTDIEGEPFEFRYSGNGYKETLTAKYINIPLTLQYETSGEHARFYISGGVKAGFALSANYQVGITSLSTSGYYPQYNAELFDPVFMGFGEFTEVAPGQQDLDTKMSWSGIFETGLKVAVGEKAWVYLGLFADYGLTSIHENSDKNLVAYPQGKPVELGFNSVLDTSPANEARLVAYGLKVRLAIN